MSEMNSLVKSRQSPSGRRLRRRLVSMLLPLLLLAGCSLARRGDFHRATEESQYLSRIGFLAADNPISINAVRDIHGSPADIFISIPYFEDDGVTPLVPNAGRMTLFFETVSEYATVSIDGVVGDIQSGVHYPTMAFHDGGANPEIRTLTVTTPTNDGPPNIATYFIHLEKQFRPVLKNPNNVDTASPLPLRFGFVDEQGTSIEDRLADPKTYFEAGTWQAPNYPVDPWIDGWRLQVDTSTLPYPPVTWQSATAGPPPRPDGFEIEFRPLFPNDHQIFLPNDIYIDQHGYFSDGTGDTRPGDDWISGSMLSFDYDPPAMHVAWWGDNANTGTDPAAPVQDWATAQANAAVFGIFDIYFAASDTNAYDMAGLGIMDGTPLVSPFFNLYGGWRSDFSSRYADDGVSNYPATVFYDSTQANGSMIDNPSAVLTVDDSTLATGFVPVLDDLHFAAGAVTPTINSGTGLNIRFMSDILVQNVESVAPQGGGTEPTAVTIVGTANSEIRLSSFSGAGGTAADSYGMYIESSTVNLQEVGIVSGDQLPGGSATGIQVNDSGLSLNDCFIITGFDDHDDFGNDEQRNVGIQADNSWVNISNSWIHTARAVQVSEAFQSNNNNVLSAVSANFIAGRAQRSSGIRMVSGAAQELKLFNSTVVAGRSTLDPSAGLRLDNMANTQIMNNTISVDDASSGTTYGIHFFGNTGSPASNDVRNNLIFSRNSTTMTGIHSDVGNISTMTVRHNDFWDSDTAVPLRLNGPDQDLKTLHLTYGPITVHGNINRSVDMDMNYNYGTEDFRIGRPRNTVPTDVLVGGEDLSADGADITEFPEGFDAWDKKDRNWNTRYGYAGVGWTMGPYEIDSTGVPRTVYVDVTGDDGHPLGTAAHPFATLDRAYTLARGGGGYERPDISDIRVEPGTYPVIATIEIDDNRPVGIYGESGGGSILQGIPGVTSVIRFSNNADGEFEHFTVDNTSGAGTTMAIDVDGAYPDIGWVSLDGGTGGTSYGIRFTNNGGGRLVHSNVTSGGAAASHGVYINNVAFPYIADNIIHGGNGSDSYGIYAVDAGGTDIRRNDIDGGGGASSTGIHVRNQWVSISDGNLIHGGDGSGFGQSVGLRLENTGAFVEGNTIIGGVNSLDTIGMELDDAPFAEIINNSIDGGSAVGGGSVSTGVTVNLSHSMRFSRNRISGGTGDDTVGLEVTSPGARSFDRNRIYGGTAMASAIGILAFNPDSAIFTNNLVHAGRASGPAVLHGFYLQNGNNAVALVNNTIYGGHSLSNDGSAITLVGNAAPGLINNIFIAGDAVPSTTAYGVNRTGPSHPSLYLNNLIIADQSSAVPYLDAGAPVTTAAALETILGGGGPIPGQYDRNIINVASPASGYFVDFTVDGSESGFASDNWRLSGSGAGSPWNSGNDAEAGALFDTGFVSSINRVDYGGSARTVPWSIGAFEY